MRCSSGGVVKLNEEEVLTNGTHMLNSAFQLLVKPFEWLKISPQISVSKGNAQDI